MLPYMREVALVQRFPSRLWTAMVRHDVGDDKSPLALDKMEKMLQECL